MAPEDPAPEEYEEDYELPAPAAAINWSDAPEEDAPNEQDAALAPEAAPPPTSEPAPETMAVPDPEAVTEPPEGIDASIAALMQEAAPAPPEIAPVLETPPAEAASSTMEEPAADTDPLDGSASPYDPPERPAAAPLVDAEPVVSRRPEPKRYEPPRPDPGPSMPPRAEADLGPAPRVGVVPRRAIDANLLAILREEAEREAAARQAEGQRLEMQEEMNLEPAAPPRRPAAKPAPPEVSPEVQHEAETEPEAAPEPAKVVAPAPPPQDPPSLRAAPQEPLRPARPTPDFSDLNSEDADEDPAPDETDPEETAPAASARVARRQRLPDIEEINSTLRASADRGRDPAALGSRPAGARGSAGFRFGFSLIVVIAAGLLALYVFAPRVAEAVPDLQPALATYVALADTARLWLDDSLRLVTEKLGQTPAN
ncbi:hypothetical protein [Rhodobacter maris]|nr:hypothetical protein [Rhodobacter maris]